MFYQQQPKRSVYFRAYSRPWSGIETHLHSFFELHCCTGGQLRLTVSGREYVLKPGEAVLVFPYQPHSFPKKEGQGCFYTFDPELISTFAKQYANCVPRENIFPFSYDFSEISEESDIFTLKSFLYAMCRRAALLEFDSAPSDDRLLLEKMFRLTETHFAESDFSLKKLTRLLGYDYGYLSKYFFRKTGMKYTFYLNQRRIARAVELLQSSQIDNIGDVAFGCGYNCVRSFNRNFREIEGQTPREYLRDR